MEVKKTGDNNSNVADELEAIVSCCSNIGGRDYQEDRSGFWLNDKNGHFFAVVLDGAGGHGGGAEAAEAAVVQAEEYWKKTKGRVKDAELYLKSFFELAHESVISESKKINKSGRAAIVAVAVNRKKIHWIYAGDCRLYRIGKDEIIERTRDDSVVQVLFESGEISEEEMGTHPDQNRLLQSLGTNEPPTPRCGYAELDDDEVILLCSDGFWENLSKNDIIKLAQCSPKERDQLLNDAVNQAVINGGESADNTTALMFSTSDVMKVEPKGQDDFLKFILLILWCLIMIGGIILIISYDFSAKDETPLKKASETLQKDIVDGPKEINEVKE